MTHVSDDRSLDRLSRMENRRLRIARTLNFDSLSSIFFVSPQPLGASLVLAFGGLSLPSGNFHVNRPGFLKEGHHFASVRVFPESALFLIKPDFTVDPLNEESGVRSHDARFPAKLNIDR